MFIKNTQTKNGFTLVELLIVMAVIAVLATIGMSGYGTAQVRARDARRRADLQVIQKGYEQYHVDFNTYATTCTTMQTTTYFPAGMPQDPTGTAYTHSPTCTATSYCVCAQLERDATGNAGANCNYLAAAADKDYYCVSQLQ